MNLSIQSKQEFFPNPFTSVNHLCESLHIPVPRTKHGGAQTLHWRLTPYAYGSINGCPRSYGRLAATDGIMCIIIQDNGAWYEGHVAWFVVEDESMYGTINEIINPRKADLMGKKSMVVLDCFLTE